MSNNIYDALDGILNAVTDDSIGLPKWEGASAEELEFSEEILKEVEFDIGPAASSDYYKTSRDRFRTMVVLARRHLPANAKLLDVGNAPGYLALALHKCGFQVYGLNLSDAWIDTYPGRKVVELFNVVACDIERQEIPFEDFMFDGIVFTEVLEHVAIKNPKEIIPDLRRKLKPNGVVLFSTPNVCNLSNIIALMLGVNVFWASSIFYGSTDRHNREFTPREVKELFEACGFDVLEFFGMNDHANWRSGTQEIIYPYIEMRDSKHALLRNTVVGVFLSR